jgi:hypothetical protein
MAMDKLDFISETYEAIENELTHKLQSDNFQKTKSENHPESFGSRYTIWKNVETLYALRLIWDGKDSWFIIEESPFTEKSEPNSWADLVIVPLDDSKIGLEYKQQIINDLINEIK